MKKHANDPPLLDWNNQPIQPRQPTPNEEMIGRYGPCRFESATCQHCKHFYQIYASKPKYRCDLRDDEKHLKRWPACAQFEQREGRMRIYDGRS